MLISSHQDFATEVRVDRLRLLWRVSLTVAILGGWVLLNIAMLQRIPLSPLFIPLGMAVVAALSTRSLMQSGSYTSAAWAYVLIMLAALGVALAVAEDQVLYVLPFAFPVLIFITGLLLKPANALFVAVVAALLIYVAPLIMPRSLDVLTIIQLSAIALTLVSAFVAALVAGDMYQIADWALANYQREVRAAGELFESQQALERSLARSTALGERLQETNLELDAARGSAEEAKHFRGQFLANMSHELRTPLNAIIGFSETMLRYPAMYDEVELPDAYGDDLEKIYSSGRQLLTLINDILDLAKVDAGKLDVRMGEVELHPLIRKVVSTAAGLIGNKPIRLETDVPEYLPLVWADSVRVEQVLLNLYSNAAKFTDRGTIRLTVAPSEGGVRISVSDTGMGISQENLDVIFEEFKQAETGGRDPRSGAGLGLAISRQLMKLMGGRIWAESELGKGSTFHFVLMLDEEDISQAEMVKARA